jgi:hypothetical protein
VKPVTLKSPALGDKQRTRKMRKKKEFSMSRRPSNFKKISLKLMMNGDKYTQKLSTTQMSSNKKYSNLLSPGKCGKKPKITKLR